MPIALFQAVRVSMILTFAPNVPNFPVDGKKFFTDITPIVCEKWENGSKRIREIGITEYFSERKSLTTRNIKSGEAAE